MLEYLITKFGKATPLLVQAFEKGFSNIGVGYVTSNAVDNVMLWTDSLLLRDAVQDGAARHPDSCCSVTIQQGGACKGA